MKSKNDSDEDGNREDQKAGYEATSSIGQEQGKGVREAGGQQMNRN